jgi:hypothetical protein
MLQANQVFASADVVTDSAKYAKVIASFTSVDQELDYLASCNDVNYVKAYVTHLVNNVVIAGDDDKANKVKEKTNKFVAFVKKHGAKIAKGGFVFGAFLAMVTGFIFMVKRNAINKDALKAGLSKSQVLLKKVVAAAVSAFQKAMGWVASQIRTLKAKSPEMAANIKKRFAMLAQKSSELKKAASGAASGAANKAGQAARQAANKAGQAGQSIKEAAKKQGQTLVKKAGEAGTSLKEAAKKQGQKAVDKIDSHRRASIVRAPSYQH